MSFVPAEITAHLEPGALIPTIWQILVELDLVDMGPPFLGFRVRAIPEEALRVLERTRAKCRGAVRAWPTRTENAWANDMVNC